MSSFGVDPFESYVNATSTFAPAKRIIKDVNKVRQDYDGVWSSLSHSDQTNVIDEHIIKPEVKVKYEDQRQQNGHVIQIFPRLKLKTGIKTVTVMLEENDVGGGGGSQGEDIDSASSSGCTYTYADEHSAPFSFRSRSQQELRFEFGDNDDKENHAGNETDNDIQTLTSPSRILSMQPVNYARMSRGNPCFAKAVQIPVVPNPVGPPPTQKKDPVPPEQINNFVYHNEQNRLVLDFGEVTLDDKGLPVEAPVDPEKVSVVSVEKENKEGGIISKMKKFSSSTLGRRKNRKSEGSLSNSSTLSHKSTVDLSSGDSESEKRHSLQPQQRHSTLPTTSSLMSTSLITAPKVVKPSVAPPPPPPNKKLPEKETKSTVPTAFPIEQTPVNQGQNLGQNPGHNPGQNPGQNSAQTPAKDQSPEEELDGFKIDLTIDAELPKTGFDFLDNW